MTDLVYIVHSDGDTASAIASRPLAEVGDMTMSMLEVMIEDFKTNGDNVMFEQRRVYDTCLRTIIATLSDGVVFTSYNQDLKFVNFTNRNSVLLFDTRQNKLLEVMYNRTKWLQKPVTMYDVLNVVCADANDKYMWSVTSTGAIVVFSALDACMFQPGYLPEGFRPLGIVVGGYAQKQAIAVVLTEDNIVQFLRYEIRDDTVITNEIVQPVETVLQFQSIVMGTNCCVVTGLDNGTIKILTLSLDNFDFKLSEMLLTSNTRITQILNKTSELVLSYIMGDRGYGHMLVVKSPQHQLYPPMRQLPSISAFNCTLKTVQLLQGTYNMDFNTPLISTVLSNLVTDKQQQAIEILSATARSMAQGENGSSFTKGKMVELREEMDRNKREHDKAIKELHELHAANMAKVKSEFTYKELQVLAETETLKQQLLGRPTQRAMAKQKEMLDNKAADIERLKTELDAEKKATAKLAERLKANNTDMAGLRAQVAALSARLQEANTAHEKKQANMTKQLAACKATYEGELDEIIFDHKTLLTKLQQEHDAAMRKQKADMQAEMTLSVENVAKTKLPVATTDMATETDANDEEATPDATLAKLRELEAYNHELRNANVAFMHHTRDMEGKWQAMFAQNQEMKSAMESGGRYTKQAYSALQTEIDALRKANHALHKAYSTLTTMTKFGFLPNGTSVETAMEMIANLMVIQEDAGRLRTENERLEQELNKIKAIVFPTVA